MTVNLRDRPPTHQGRQYDPADPESSAESLLAWIESAVLNVTATVDATPEGFRIVTETDVDGRSVLEGVPGDWVVIMNGYSPTVVADAELLRRFEVIP